MPSTLRRDAIAAADATMSKQGCLQQHQQYQQCMQICQGSGTTAARSPEMCRNLCQEKQGGEYYSSLRYSNPDYDKGKVHLKCMDRCKTSLEPQLCMRMCKHKHCEKEERETISSVVQ
ncbi:hypothetical protein ACLB2K_041885 [Fragaria x ananassa]